MDIGLKFYGDPSNRFWDISVRMKVVDKLTDIYQIHGQLQRDMCTFFFYIPISESCKNC